MEIIWANFRPSGVSPAAVLSSLIMMSDRAAAGHTNVVAAFVEAYRGLSCRDHYEAPVRVELSCAACGGNNFSLDEAVSDDTQIFCRDCGHEVGTFGRVKELLLAELRRPLAQRSDVVLDGDEERRAS